MDKSLNAYSGKTIRSRAVKVPKLDFQVFMEEFGRGLRAEMDAFHDRMDVMQECFQQRQPQDIDLFEQRTKRRSSTLSSYGSVALMSPTCTLKCQRGYKPFVDSKYEAPPPVLSKLKDEKGVSGFSEEHLQNYVGKQVSEEGEDSDSLAKHLELPDDNQVSEREKVVSHSSKEHLKQSDQDIVYYDQNQMHPHEGQSTKHSNFLTKADEEITEVFLNENHEKVFPPNRGNEHQLYSVTGTEVVLVHEEKAVAERDATRIGIDLILPYFPNMFEIKHRPTGIGVRAVLMQDKKTISYQMNLHDLRTNLFQVEGDDMILESYQELLEQKPPESKPLEFMKDIHAAEATLIVRFVPKISEMTKDRKDHEPEEGSCSTKRFMYVQIYTSHFSYFVHHDTRPMICDTPMEEMEHPTNLVSFMD